MSSTKWQKLTGFIIDLSENVLDGFVVMSVLGLGVGRGVASLPAPLHHLSGLWGGEGLQAWGAVQNVLDDSLHGHSSLELQRHKEKLWETKPQNDHPKDHHC